MPRARRRRASLNRYACPHSFNFIKSSIRNINKVPLPGPSRRRAVLENFPKCSSRPTRSALRRIAALAISVMEAAAGTSRARCARSLQSALSALVAAESAGLRARVLLPAIDISATCSAGR
ncbi:hypothetical protein EVAR_44073_1 [Eumeta japonica]|uniref:Uncharacterized protein n=1 Tax=Eumeta variegata TaxID=151549 RepID=A0A4C1X0G9_EUMVA|nr:hypothetical protein EVAR_44073_1 [Eumeta japonica]